ncbi:MAG TPA: hypothetical protein IAA52_04425 [Candidatus Pullichristensenella stercorigallinarum]|uniref:DUF6305 domain-containing protein n=1 Tax=Candidatus Pullichristensenella stercorigallinarum TaxID=2840909 RepID=A0A9D1CW72_9FIRM|nr:hypothetical protein [Candidatus Pullichristensenella stercorigallinarum]
MKKLLALLLCLLMAMSMSVVAFAETAEEAPAEEAAAEAPAEETAEEPAAGETAEEGAVTISLPILMTSAGQSADVQMFNAIASRSGVEATARELVEADDIEVGEYNTLVIVVGGSSKGLGAAGIDAEQEQARVDAIIEKLKDSVTIVVAHIGGQARRGELSDGFINAVLPYAQYLIVVEEGDSDGLFSNYAAENNIPISICPDIASVGEVFAGLISG